LFLVPASAWATRPRTIVAEEDIYRSHAGSARDLPVGCQYSPRDLVAHAYTMPAVQQAMQIFQSRGYVRRAAGDTAINGCQSGQSSSGVTLTWEKPGAFIDSMKCVVATIVVRTAVNPASAEAGTWVSGGLLVIDGNNGKVSPAQDLGYFLDDPAFDVNYSAAATSSASPAPVQVTIGDGSRIGAWARCTGFGSLGCMGGIMMLGGPGFTSLKLSLLMAQPELGLAIIEVCTLTSGISCLGNLW
jgi:hypothetical protein